MNDAQTWTLIAGFFALMVTMIGMTLRTVRAEIAVLGVRIDGRRHVEARSPRSRRPDGRHPLMEAERGQVLDGQPTSESRNTRRGPSSTGTWFSTTSTRQPAASADLAPVLESSMATHSSGGTPSAAAAVR